MHDDCTGYLNIMQCNFSYFWVHNLSTRKAWYMLFQWIIVFEKSLSWVLNWLCSRHIRHTLWARHTRRRKWWLRVAQRQNQEMPKGLWEAICTASCVMSSAPVRMPMRLICAAPSIRGYASATNNLCHLITSLSVLKFFKVDVVRLFSSLVLDVAVFS